MIDPNQVWESLSVQTEKLMSLAVSAEIATEVREDIALLIDCALISLVHPQRIIQLVEEEEFEILRVLIYSRAH